MDGRKDGWVSGWMDRGDRWKGGWMDELVDECMDGRKDGWRVGGWKDG